MFDRTRQGQEVRNTKSKSFGIVRCEFVRTNGKRRVEVTDRFSGKVVVWDAENVQFPR